MIPAALAKAAFVPVLAGEKCPTCKGWPEVRLNREQADQHLGAGSNIALRVGCISGGLVDADLDSVEALAWADLYLPVTGAVFGRASKPRSHRLYRSPGAVFASFADPLDGTMLLE